MVTKGTGADRQSSEFTKCSSACRWEVWAELIISISNMPFVPITFKSAKNLFYTPSNASRKSDPSTRMKPVPQPF